MEKNLFNYWNRLPNDFFWEPKRPNQSTRLAILSDLHIVSYDFCVMEDFNLVSKEISDWLGNRKFLGTGKIYAIDGKKYSENVRAVINKDEDISQIRVCMLTLAILENLHTVRCEDFQVLPNCSTFDFYKYDLLNDSITFSSLRR